MSDRSGDVHLNGALATLAALSRGPIVGWSGLRMNSPAQRLLRYCWRCRRWSSRMPGKVEREQQERGQQERRGTQKLFFTRNGGPLKRRRAFRHIQHLSPLSFSHRRKVSFLTLR